MDRVGIYIYGDYVYYATPTADKDKDNNVANTHLDFKSAKLDGTETMKGYYFRLSSNSANYRFVEVDGVVYCMYEESGTLKEDESELVRSALEFDDMKVEDILVPRVDVQAVEETWTMDEVREVFQKTGYSRLPVYRETIDNVVGLIHERDFFLGYVSGEQEIKRLVQDIVFTSEYTRISTLLKQLQKRKIHMAAVSDEYGGLVGIVTMEDILEELVGEIWDEHDEEEVLFGKIADGEYWVDGKCELPDFFALYEMEGAEDECESNTVGGWVTERYGAIPPIGETLRFKKLEIKVVKATEQKVLKVRTSWNEDLDDEDKD